MSFSIQVFPTICLSVRDSKGEKHCFRELECAARFPVEKERDARAIHENGSFGNCASQYRGTILQSHLEAVCTSRDNECTEVTSSVCT